jgi:salicylate hydroxylase
MLPFGGQGAMMAIEDGGSLGFLLKDTTDPQHIEERLDLFQTLRKSRASRVQLLSSVRAGREKEVEDRVRMFADAPDACECSSDDLSSEFWAYPRSYS